MSDTTAPNKEELPLYQQGANARKQLKEQNIELVRRMLIRGVRKTIDIQVSLENMDPPIKLTPRTIQRYKTIIRRRTSQKVADKIGINKTVEELLVELKEEYDEVQRELWRVFHSCSQKQANAKVQALKEIRAAAGEFIDRLQSMGMVYKAPEKHQMLGADGEPVDPTMGNIQVLNQQFTMFIKAQWQDPIGNTGTMEVVKRDESAKQT